MRTRCELIGGGELTTRNENQVQVVEPSVAASCKPRCGGDLMTMECGGSRFTIQEDKEKGLTINFVTTKANTTFPLPKTIAPSRNCGWNFAIVVPSCLLRVYEYTHQPYAKYSSNIYLVLLQIYLNLGRTKTGFEKRTANLLSPGSVQQWHRTWSAIPVLCLESRDNGAIIFGGDKTTTLNFILIG
ncbi:hypothetical protein JHK87_019145 [Glycine soja]|nr:hypothetical protein JHK87_019145 [Glycine soja]